MSLPSSPPRWALFIPLFSAEEIQVQGIRELAQGHRSGRSWDVTPELVSRRSWCFPCPPTSPLSPAGPGFLLLARYLLQALVS